MYQVVKGNASNVKHITNNGFTTTRCVVDDKVVTFSGTTTAINEGDLISVALIQDGDQYTANAFVNHTSGAEALLENSEHVFMFAIFFVTGIATLWILIGILILFKAIAHLRAIGLVNKTNAQLKA